MAQLESQPIDSGRASGVCPPPRPAGGNRAPGEFFLPGPTPRRSVVCLAVADEQRAGRARVAATSAVASSSGHTASTTSSRSRRNAGVASAGPPAVAAVEPREVETRDAASDVDGRDERGAEGDGDDAAGAAHLRQRFARRGRRRPRVGRAPRQRPRPRRRRPRGSGRRGRGRRRPARLLKPPTVASAPDGATARTDFAPGPRTQVQDAAATAVAPARRRAAWTAPSRPSPRSTPPPLRARTPPRRHRDGSRAP